MNNFPSKDIVEHIKKQYPIGCRVRLVRMNDIGAPPIGTKGSVEFIDDTGTIFCLWDNGSRLGVVYGEDLCVQTVD